MEVVLRTSAKVNLALEVLGKRGDGYHEIATVLQAVDLFDRLKLEAADTLSLHTDDPDLPTDDGNLVMRAARLLQKAAGIEAGARIRLTSASRSRRGWAADRATRRRRSGGSTGCGGSAGPRRGSRSWRWSWAWTCRSSWGRDARWPGGAVSG